MQAAATAAPSNYRLPVKQGPGQPRPAQPSSRSLVRDARKSASPQGLRANVEAGGHVVSKPQLTPRRHNLLQPLQIPRLQKLPGLKRQQMQATSGLHQLIQASAMSRCPPPNVWRWMMLQAMSTQQGTSLPLCRKNWEGY